MSVTNTKKLEVAQHRWQRKILMISWKDMVTNKVVRERTGQDSLESIEGIDSDGLGTCTGWVPTDYHVK